MLWEEARAARASSVEKTGHFGGGGLPLWPGNTWGGAITLQVPCCRPAPGVLRAGNGSGFDSLLWDHAVFVFYSHISNVCGISSLKHVGEQNDSEP